MSALVPARRYGHELLDDPTIDPALVLRSVRDITRANRAFRGTSAAVAEVARHFAALGPAATLLDVGTGLGDVPDAVRRVAAQRGIVLETVGVDCGMTLLEGARARLSHVVCATGIALPFATGSVDVALCSQTLHHFRDDAASALLRELDRVARVAVVLSDLRRSWIAAGGFWASSFALGFHPVTRHDGVLSVLRGFTDEELRDTVHAALGIRPRVRRRLGFRVTTSWTPTHVRPLARHGAAA
jgi:SAM-dependent methyltransferase